MLRTKRQWNEIIKLEKALLELFPGTTDTLLSIGEAQLASGDHESGLRTLQQVKLLNPSLSAQVDQLKANYILIDEEDELFDDLEPLDMTGPLLNALGIQSAILVDPDSAVQQSVKQVMAGAGVQDLEVFDSGQKAWDWISNGQQPSLIIMEWRTLDLTGVQFIQRVRQRLISVPIMVVSSLVSQSEVPLVKEMGVNAVVEKPFDNATLMAEIITLLQQQQYPTEQISMDRKIIQCLQLGNKVEANRLIGIYLSNPDYDDAGKRRMEAEYAFYEGHYMQSCTLASAALKQSHDSLELLNLLGKALMKLGDFESALKCMKKAQSLSPANIERACRMASLCAEMGDFEDAEDQLLQAKNLDAKNILVLEAEAQLALGSGDAERATKAMASLESLHRIVAFINNKAVALVRNNKFEEGIALYKSALEALPPPWGHAHDTVCYNLSLAHIRFSEYERALQSLEKVKSGPTTGIGKKAHSLRKKILHAQQTNTHLTISVEAKELNNPNDPKALVPEIDFAALVDGIAASQGDICCYRIFSSEGIASEESIKLFQKAPKLKQRRPAS
ncbi:response regulator [Oligoflexus tunisiensis]|uniref:response regulator n=1 Tax=Oligoflexus tunisiensis TaxID=708132 RepID=UPI001C406027|nr:response regulator [Oligoflexus tunisiensis]